MTLAMHSTDGSIAQQAAAAVIIAKRDALVAEQAGLLEQRSDILTRLRRVDRELADCRAAARLFQLDLDFPPDERESNERLINLRLRETSEIASKALSHSSAQQALQGWARRMGPVEEPLQVIQSKGEAPSTASPTTSPQPKLTSAAEMALSNHQLQRPALRDVLLGQLKAAENAGVKAASLREHFERTYGEVIHEKTVGMTLYRLFKQKLVHRNGHMWFFGPQAENALPASPENPGVDAPGPTQMVS